MSNIPEPWATAIIKAGYKDPRYAEPTPSLRALAEEAGLHTTTVSKMVRGVGVAKVENVAAVAEKLGVDVRTVSDWVKQARAVSEPYVAPAEADLLTQRERDALTELIRAVTESRRSGDGNAAASTQAGGSPAVEGVRMRARTPSGPLPGSPSQEPTRSPGRRARR